MHDDGRRIGKYWLDAATPDYSAFCFRSCLSTVLFVGHRGSCGPILFRSIGSLSLLIFAHSSFLCAFQLWQASTGKQLSQSNPHWITFASARVRAIWSSKPRRPIFCHFRGPYLSRDLWELIEYKCKSSHLNQFSHVCIYIYIYIYIYIFMFYYIFITYEPMIFGLAAWAGPCHAESEALHLGIYHPHTYLQACRLLRGKGGGNRRLRLLEWCRRGGGLGSFFLRPKP